jgi:hypothetical protein
MGGAMKDSPSFSAAVMGAAFSAKPREATRHAGPAATRLTSAAPARLNIV